ncbi:sigma-E factor regulatory protein RseB domain-containing protein [Spirillospora sp. CA-255316]
MTGRTPAGRPGRRMRVALVCGLAGAVALAAALAGDARDSRRARNDPDAVRLLRAAADAALRVRYEGTQFLTTWNASGPATHRVKVEHTPGDGTYFTPHSSAPSSPDLPASGQPAPQSQAPSRVGASAAPGAGAPPVSGAQPEAGRAYQPDTLPVWGGSVGFTSDIFGLLIRNYEVVRGPEAVVCGRRARVVEARRADGTAAGRFWIDAATGLMLHRELIDGRGRAVAAAGFSELRVAPAGGGGSGGGSEPLAMTSMRTPVPSARPSGSVPAALPWADRLEDEELAILRDQGWPVPGALPGRLTLYDARRPASEGRSQGRPGSGAKRANGAGSGNGVVHLSYSDGLAAVSVFVQRGTLDETKFSGWRRTASRGRTVFRRDSLQHWAVWERDGYVFTVLTDAPEDTADSVVAALPHGEDAFRARLGRGFRRLVSWINPFG